MTATAVIFDSAWDGYRGTIQPVRNVIDKYTRFGDDRIWVQLIKREAQVSTITAWVVLDSEAEAQGYMLLLGDVIGLQGQVTLGASYYPSAYLLDVTFSLKKLTAIILEATFQIVIDSRDGEGSDEIWFGGNGAEENLA
jgi:hypothetical protein